MYYNKTLSTVWLFSMLGFFIIMWPLKKLEHTSTPHRAAKLWDADLSSLTLIHDEINVVYRFKQLNTHRNIFLKITLRSMNELIAATDYQKYIFNRGAPVAEPLESTHGHYIETITQHELTFLAHAATEVPGKAIHFDHVDLETYRCWGKSLAQLHQASQHYVPKANYTFLSWHDLWRETFSYIHAETEEIKQEYQEIDSWLKTQTNNPDIYGLTHGDHWINNVIYDGQKVSFIDFDEPVYHWFMADIARPFAALADEPQTTWQPKLDAYLDGYRSVLPITDTQITAIPWFIRMKNLDIKLWKKNNWIAGTYEK